MTTTRPTDQAKSDFNFAHMWLHEIINDNMLGTDVDQRTFKLAMGLINISNGLSNLSVGLRATYMKLEEIERQLKQPKR